MIAHAAAIAVALALLCTGCGHYAPADWPDDETRARGAAAPPSEEEACDD